MPSWPGSPTCDSWSSELVCVMFRELLQVVFMSPAVESNKGRTNTVRKGPVDLVH